MQKQPRFFYGYVIVAMCFLVFMGVMGMVTAFPIFFSPLIEAMGWSRAATSAAFSLNALVGGICGIIGGYFNDRLGPRVVLPVFCVFSAAGYLLLSQMTEIWHYYLFYGLLAGIGSNVFVPCMSTVARWFTARRGLVSGIAFSGAGFGLVVLPPLINWWIELYDWRVALLIIGGMLAVITVLAVIFLRNDPSGMGLRPYGADLKKEEVGSVQNVSFTVREAFYNRNFWLLNLSMLCYGFCFLGFQVHLAVSANDAGISTAGSSTILSVLGIANLVGQLGLGSLGDRLGFKRAFVLGLGCIIVAIAIIFFADRLWVFIVFASLLGLAFGNCSTQESPLLAWIFGLASHGALLGIAAFCWTCGGALGSYLFGVIYDAHGSYESAFWLAGAVALVAFALSLFLRQAVKKPSLAAR